MPRARELAELATSYDSGGLPGMRNRIINGAMVIDQRNAGAAITVSGAGQIQYVMDRFFQYNNTGTTYTAQQSTDAPAGFNYSSLASFSSSISPSATTDGAHTTQIIEGFNIADLGWGTASAQTVTLSFWVKSGLTGAHGLALMTDYNSGATTIGYPALYTVNAANTWEYKTVTIPGPTNGTWNTTNSRGIFVRWYYCAGSNFNGTPNSWAIKTGSYGAAGTIYGYAPTGMTNIAQAGNSFRVTGVQIEKGSTATSFDYRPYGTELELCQRYLPVLQGNGTGTAYGSMGICNSTTGFQGNFIFSVTPRVAPTGIATTTVGNFAVNDSASAQTATAISFVTATLNECMFGVTVSSGLTQFRPAKLQISSGSQIQFTGCEL
jgi:hypothetical protein